MTRQSVPSTIQAGQLSMCREILEDSPSHEVVKVSETPWNEPKSSHAEETIQHLGVDLYPDLP